MENKKFRKIPPEGGWGYVVAVSVFLTLSLHFGPQPSFGVLYVDFLRSVGASTTSVTSAHSVFYIFYSISGLFANALFKKFSCRQVALLGAVFYVAGHFSTIFINTVWQLIITYGILPGIGYGLILPAVFTCFNGYFTRKRATAFLAAASVVGLSFLCYPILIYSLLEKYGFRGTLAVLAAITAHMLYIACSLQPYEKHLVLEIIPEAEQGEIKHLLNSESPRKKYNHSGDEETSCETPELLEEVHLSEKLDMQNKNEEKRDRTFLQEVIEFFDLTLLKDFTYVNLIIGISFAEYSVLAFLVLQPLYLLLEGWTKEEASICATIIGASDIVSKIFLAILNYYYELKSRNIFLIGTLLTAVGRIVFSFTSNYIAVLFITAVLGFFKSWIFGTVTLIFSEHIPLKQFPAAYGLFMFLHGVIIMILGPIVGYIRDITGSYMISFHLLTLFLMVCVIPWTGELIWMKMKRKDNGAK